MAMVLTSGHLGTALVFGIVGGAAASLIGVLIARTITYPLAALTRSAEAIANGATSAPLGLDFPGREMAHLATTFDRMAQALRQEAALAAEQRDTLGAVLTTMADGVVLLDATGHTRLINPAGLRMLSLVEDSRAGRPFFELAADHEIVAIADQALHGETADIVVELERNMRTLQIHAAPLRSDEGGALLLLHDLTELRRLDQVRQEFVANASHELLTPIGTVRALADTLAHGGLEDRKAARRFLRRLQIEADRLTVLVRDLLDLAQAQSGELRLTLEETDVRAVVATVAERMQARAAKAGIALYSHYATDLPPVFADAGRLEQVLMNLLHNAVKFTPEGGSVQMTARATAEEVVMQVIDTGVGIASADLPRVFERFYKVRAAAVGTSGGGTGLGLAIARHLVQAMRGRIWAESELGHGSTFSVALPSADTALMDGVDRLPATTRALDEELPAPEPVRVAEPESQPNVSRLAG